MKTLILSHLPKAKSILQVYAVAAFLVYGWTLALFLWKLPSWLMYMHAAEIFGVLSYAMLTNLLESLVLIAALVGLAVCLPGKWLRDVFVESGTVIMISAVLSLMFYHFQYGHLRSEFNDALRTWGAVTLLIAIVLAVLFARVGVLRSFISELADRLVVFLYILMPLSVVSFLIIIVRNMV